MSLVVQISDTHILPPGSLLYGKTNSAAHLAAVVKQINNMKPQPDVVLITGDLVEKPQEACYMHFLALIEPLRAPTYILPGNHDSPEFMAEFFRGTPYFPVDDETCQFVVDGLPFRILMLNSHCPHSQLPEYPANRLAWLEGQLEQSSEPTLIAIHHPPMVTGIAFVDMVGPQWFARLKQLLSRHANVKLVICGHSHMDMSGRIAQVPVYMAPSTSHQLIADRGLDIAPWYINRGAPPVLHQFLGGEFLSGSYYWPEGFEGRRIDDDSGIEWDTLKMYMRGRRKAG